MPKKPINYIMLNGDIQNYFFFAKYYFNSFYILTLTLRIVPLIYHLCELSILFS